MVAIRGVAHFSIPVSDVANSARFYTEVVGCRHLFTTPNGRMPFLDAAGTCLILVKRDPPINPVLDNHVEVLGKLAGYGASGEGVKLYGHHRFPFL